MWNYVKIFKQFGKRPVLNSFCFPENQPTLKSTIMERRVPPIVTQGISAIMCRFLFFLSAEVRRKAKMGATENVMNIWC